MANPTRPRSPRDIVLAFFCLAALLLAPARAASLQEIRTQAESSGFTVYTAYDSMMVYLGRVQAGSPDMRLGTYGETHQGRALPYAVFSRAAVTDPEEAWRLGRPILVLAAGIHGGERTLRESVLILLRELATPGTPMNATLDELTILVVPQINPDGSSAQMPQRGNLWGIDLNRDFMKLEQPEIQGYVENVILRWSPHLFVDGHNGGSFPYNINYQCPSHPAADPRITALCDDLIFPAIDGALEADGYRSWYYTGGNETRWEVGGHDPRIGRNYGGLANTVAILFESPGSQVMEIGVRSGLLAYQTVVAWARDNSELLMRTVNDARRETVALGSAPSGEVPIEVEYAPEDRRVEYLIGVGSGQDREIVAVQSDSLMKRPVVTLSRPRPWAYILPRDAESAVELLLRHDIQVERLRAATEVTVSAYTIGDFSYESAYNHRAALKLDVEETVTLTTTLPSGSYVVRTGQVQGRVAAHLLEAETRDGVVYWNRMDAWIPKAEIQAFREGRGEAPILPIFKLMTPTALPTELIR
jgi:hypothetical protein